MLIGGNFNNPLVHLNLASFQIGAHLIVGSNRSNLEVGGSHRNVLSRFLNSNRAKIEPQSGSLIIQRNSLDFAIGGQKNGLPNQLKFHGLPVGVPQFRHR